MSNAYTTSGAKTEALISKINQQMLIEMPKMNLAYKQLAFTDSTTDSELANYPIRVTSFNFNKQLPYEDAQYTKPTIVNIVVSGVDFKTPLEMQSLGAFSNTYNLVERQAPDFMRILSRVFDREWASLINKNGLAYDGQPFFGVHKSNHALPTSPNNINVLSNTPPNKAGVLAALKQLQSMIGFDGNLLLPDLDYRDITFVVPSILEKISLSEVIHAGLTAEAVGATAGGSTDTRLAGYGNIVVVPELRNTKVAGSDKRWYALATGMKNHLPSTIVRDFKLPQLRFVPPNSYLDHQRMAQAFFGEAAGGSGYGIPSTIVRCDY